MRLDDEKSSSNVEDRRGQGGGFGRGGIRVPMGRRGGGGIGIGTIIILGILWLVFGINPLDMLSGNLSPQQQQTQQVPQSPSGTGTATNDEWGQFAGKVLGTTERTWTRIFQENGRVYQAPRLVLFSGFVQSACGNAQSAMGPFYCPRDSKVYIDLTFFQDMRAKLGAGGDFAYAYVIAHEVGHHVQNQLGIADKVLAARMRSPQEVANQLSVRMELQADCFAGVWARDNKHLLEEGDIEEGLNAASAIGDDRLQRRSQGYVVPESFTHGTSEQRMSWLKRGIDTGSISACDTFS
ncbi:MAG: neutral zinc metallopeptidase [Anderseniella sp.]|jgi:predicted metalloprotease|nr:neutral zinc metallopeptidase [Anderseniella sp.]